MKIPNKNRMNTLKMLYAIYMILVAFMGMFVIGKVTENKEKDQHGNAYNFIWDLGRNFFVYLIGWEMMKPGVKLLMESQSDEEVESYQEDVDYNWDDFLSNWSPEDAEKRIEEFKKELAENYQWEEFPEMEEKEPLVHSLIIDDEL